MQNFAAESTASVRKKRSSDVKPRAPRVKREKVIPDQPRRTSARLAGIEADSESKSLKINWTSLTQSFAK